jgi:hypothetical protein
MGLRHKSRRSEDVRVTSALPLPSSAGAARPECVESRCDAVALGSNISVAAPFVRRCLTGSTVAPFPHPAHRTGQADFPHPALGQNLTLSPTARRVQAGSSVRGRSARKDARVDRSRPPSIRIDQASASALSASRTACLACSRAPSA